MRLTFSTPCAWEKDFFGATFGVAGKPEPTEVTVIETPFDLNGIMLTGTYEQCLSAVPDTQFQAGIVLLGNSGEEDIFIRNLQEKAKCPLTGGSSAIDPVSGKKGLVAGEQQAAVYLIYDDRFNVWVESKNIHENIVKECSVEMYSPRVFKSIDGEEPLEWFNEKRKAFGFPETDFEHMTLSDKLGVNAHLSVSDGKLVSGRDLEETMLLRYVSPGDVYLQMQEFYKNKNALICGCAGLKGILPRPLEAGSVGLFLFGEVCTIDGISKFGNLMLSKLFVKRK